MQETTIVKLGTADANDASSFEQAFGEFSEIRGKGRKRRNKRKSERQLNRIGRRKARKEARQEMRAEQQEARQTRRDVRKSRRVGRKAMGHGPEAEMDQTSAQEMASDNLAPQTAPESQNGAGYAPEGQGNGGYEPQGTEQDSGYAPQGGEQGGGYAPQGNGGGGEDWGAPPAGMEEEESGDEGEESPSGVYQDDNDDSYGSPEGTGGEGWGFDGVMGAEDRFYEMDNAPKVKISPKVAELTKKIEWNKELISRLRVQKAKIEGANGNPNDVNKQIAIRRQRIMDLQTQLQQYAQFEGDYSCADGEKPTKKMYSNRQNEVAHARNMAVRQRKQLRRHMGKNTPVAKGLNPEFEPQRIVVPPRTSSATGLNGLDLMDDYDAPDARFVELSSNADGVKKKINWVGIGIGVGVAAVAIWAMRKYKVI